MIYNRPMNFKEYRPLKLKTPPCPDVTYQLAVSSQEQCSAHLSGHDLARISYRELIELYDKEIQIIKPNRSDFYKPTEF